LKEQYKRRFPEGDKLGRVARLIDWSAFRPILEPLFKNNGEGRHHTDVVLMMKVLVLQSWYGLADEMVETECKDRLTFQNFLGYPSDVPDSRTVWLFKERIAQQKGKEKELWDELKHQLKKFRVAVKKGQMKDAVLIELGGWRMEGQHGPVAEVAPHTGFAQDSTIIEADPGVPTEEELKRLKEIEEENRRKKEEERQRRKNEGNGGSDPPPRQEQQRQTKREQSRKDDTALPPAIAAMTNARPKPRGEKAKTTRSRDGTWTKKHGRSFFGYKLHTKDDLSGVFIDDFEVTTASVNDGTIDLTRKREVCVRDRGYPQGGRGLCISMIKGTRGHPVTKEDRKLNRFLAKVRAPVEHPYAVMKRIFHAGEVRVTTIVRVNVRMTFVCTCYNLFRAVGLASAKGM